MSICLLCGLAGHGATECPTLPLSARTTLASTSLLGAAKAQSLQLAALAQQLVQGAQQAAQVQRIAAALAPVALAATPQQQAAKAAVAAVPALVGSSTSVVDSLLAAVVAQRQQDVLGCLIGQAALRTQVAAASEREFFGSIARYDEVEGLGQIDSPEPKRLYGTEVLLTRAQFIGRKIGDLVAFSVELNGEGLPQARYLRTLSSVEAGALRVAQASSALSTTATTAAAAGISAGAGADAAGLLQAQLLQQVSLALDTADLEGAMAKHALQLQGTLQASQTQQKPSLQEQIKLLQQEQERRAQEQERRAHEEEAAAAAAEKAVAEAAAAEAAEAAEAEAEAALALERSLAVERANAAERASGGHPPLPTHAQLHAVLRSAMAAGAANDGGSAGGRHGSSKASEVRSGGGTGPGGLARSEDAPPRGPVAAFRSALVQCTGLSKPPPDDESLLAGGPSSGALMTWSRTRREKVDLESVFPEAFVSSRTSGGGASSSSAAPPGRPGPTADDDDDDDDDRRKARQDGNGEKSFAFSPDLAPPEAERPRGSIMLRSRSQQRSRSHRRRKRSKSRKKLRHKCRKRSRSTSLKRESRRALHFFDVTETPAGIIPSDSNAAAVAQQCASQQLSILDAGMAATAPSAAGLQLALISPRLDVNLGGSLGPGKSLVPGGPVKPPTGGASKVCVRFLTGTCFEAQCPHRHPGTEAEIGKWLTFFNHTPCRWGNSCRTPNCLYYHSNRASYPGIGGGVSIAGYAPCVLPSTLAALGGIPAAVDATAAAPETGAGGSAKAAAAETLAWTSL